MNKEEIIQAITDDKMMPFIQPDQLAEIVNFVIKNYKPSLPSDLDEAAQKVEYYYDVGEEYGCLCCHRGDIKDVFKAGAEWMAEQGETRDDITVTGDFDDKAHIFPIPSSKFNPGDKVVVQIRKK